MKNILSKGKFLKSKKGIYSLKKNFLRINRIKIIQNKLANESSIIDHRSPNSLAIVNVMNT